MKEQLCRAFCDNLQIRTVPAGMAVSTVFSSPDGDRIGFYVHQDSGTGMYRIEDNGLALPMLEASGFNLKSGTRAEAFNGLLKEYGVEIDHDTREFIIDHVDEHSLSVAAMKFVAFSLRVRDFMLMTERAVANTFRDDVLRMLQEAAPPSLRVEAGQPVSESLADFVPDFTLRGSDRPPVLVFLGTSDARVLEAVIIQLRAQHEIRVPCSVIALLEKEKSITSTVRRQASNRLTTVAEFRGDEVAAIQRIIAEAIGPQQTVH